MAHRIGFDAACTVWVGKLPEGITTGDLEAAGAQTGGTVSSAWLMKGNTTGRITFSTQEEAKAAIEALNGAQLGDATIECDTWTQREDLGKRCKGKKKPSNNKSGGHGGNGGRSWGVQNKFDKSGPMGMMSAMMTMMQAMMGQGGGKGSWGKGKGKGGKGGGASGGKKTFDPELSVWVGNLPKECKDSDLKQLGSQAGTCKLAKVLKPGTGGLVFATAAEATAAIPLLNGAQVGDNIIEADVWTTKN